MKHSKALFIVVLGALFLVGLRSEENTSRTIVVSPGGSLSFSGASELLWSATTDNSILFGSETTEIVGPESISAKLSEIEGKTLRELEELVQGFEDLIQKMVAERKLAQETHDQELRRIGAAKFPSQFGLAGKLDTLKDFSEVRWSPRTPSCQSRRFQGVEWFGGITTLTPDDGTIELLGLTDLNTHTTDLPFAELTH